MSKAPLTVEQHIAEVEKGLPELGTKRRFRYLKLSIERLILAVKDSQAPATGLPSTPIADGKVAKATRKSKKEPTDGES